MKSSEFRVPSSGAILDLRFSILVLLLCASVAFAQTKSPPTGTLFYAGALPGKILVIDEDREQVVDEIKLETGIPRGLTLSFDKKKLYVYSVKDNGVEVVDLESRKVTNHFVLNKGNRTLRIAGFAPDPQDRFLYLSFFAAVKKEDRFEIEKPKFGVVDLAQQKIIKTVDFPKDDDTVFSMQAGYRVSPDGKFLYVFRENVLIYDTQDFKQVEKIELSKPLVPWMQTLNLGPGEDPFDEPGIVTSVFNATDPVVHRAIFGIAHVDLAKRTFDFTPVGPSTPGMSQLRLTPDRKTGYLVAFMGSGGNRRPEFWVFDMDTNALAKRIEFSAPINFQFSVSGTGQQLYIYGRASKIDIYDASTLALKKTIDVGSDMTTGLVMVPGAASPMRVADGRR